MSGHDLALCFLAALSAWVVVVLVISLAVGVRDFNRAQKCREQCTRDGCEINNRCRRYG